MKHVYALVVAVFFLVFCLSIEGANAKSMESEKQKAFVEIFDDEVQNRAFALVGLKALSKNEESPLKKEFWADYIALEHLNQKKYHPFADKYNITQEPGGMASLKASLLVMANGWFPSYTWKTLHKATVKHVTKLEGLVKLASEEDKAFVDYVVNQEKVQAEAIKLMINGREQLAVELLSEFVAEHK